MKAYKSYFRPEIDAMDGYTPGEQPKIPDLLKLNTNENPYPPCPAVLEGLKKIDGERLRLYPDPAADKLRDAIAEIYGYKRENIIAANGSDDMLTIAFRAFTDKQRSAAFLYPTYSLYPVLAGLQGCEYTEIPLTENFSVDTDYLLEKAAPANLLIITRPNAPTSNCVAINEMRKICAEFDGIVFIDEAYADFSADNCLDFVREFPNVIVSRTVSKSYSLAGLRLGFAIASPELINGMMKVKDSYNVNMLTQFLAEAAIRDQSYLRETAAKIIASRNRLCNELKKMGFRVVDSQSNFIFAAPPDGDGEKLFKALRKENIIVRYFPGEATGKYVRITVGTETQIQRLIDFLKKQM
ncbi:MAG: histidinol-phosphate transaminase [Victivallales bacterium]